MLVSPEELETESLLTEIQEARRAAIVERDEVSLARRRVSDKERQLAARLVSIEAERASVLGESRAEARRELQEVRQAIEELQAELRDRKSPATLGEEWLAQAQARLAEQESIVQPPAPAIPFEEVTLPGGIELGDTVWIRGLNTTGEVIGVDGDMADVQVGNFGVQVDRRDLERRARSQAAEPPRPVLEPTMQRAPNVELDLRGLRVEEVLPRVDKYLDDAFLAGMPFVRIVHGKGTGALRQAVRRQLGDHPLVKSQRAGERGEGGSGVTIAYLLEP
jgi:DNA mismatch repair protein MutS2